MHAHVSVVKYAIACLVMLVKLDPVGAEVNIKDMTVDGSSVADKNILRISRWKRTAILMAGFGLGGLLWGLEAYRGTVGSNEAFTSPFSYILGAVAMGFFGGLAMAIVKKIDSRNSSHFNASYLVDRETLKIVGVSVVAWVAAFVVGLYASDWTIIAGSIISPILGLIEIMTKIDMGRLLFLEPSMYVGQLWVNFLVLAVVFCLVLHLIVMRMSKKVFISTISAFTVSALVSPIVGNVIGGILDLLLASYLITFLLPGLVLGMILAKQ